MKILQINSSARSAGANPTRRADAITTRLKAANPAAVLELRDLATNPHPVLDEAALGALFTPAEQRTPEHARRHLDEVVARAPERQSDDLRRTRRLRRLG